MRGMVPGVAPGGVEKAGTEGTMCAVRLARAVTGAATIVKFRGAYHGHADACLVEAGSGAATLGVPSSPGVTTGAAGDTFVAEFNDIDSVKACFDRSEHGIACLIVEPVPGNMGCVLPAPGFLAALRGLCDDHGALLVFDEVMTGFRLAPGGAQERYGVLPDLTTLGKIVGGGLPGTIRMWDLDEVHEMAADPKACECANSSVGSRACSDSTKAILTPSPFPATTGYWLSADTSVALYSRMKTGPRNPVARNV